MISGFGSRLYLQVCACFYSTRFNIIILLFKTLVNIYLLCQVSVANCTYNTFLQVRGRSTFNTLESAGPWSNAEILTIERVSAPSDIEVVAFGSVNRALVNQKLKVSIRVSLEWTPPDDLDPIDGYNIILSRQPVSKYYSPSTSDELKMTTVTVSHNNGY